MTERGIQEAAADALRACGFEVLHTSAWRQRGASGVSPGVPDLLVASDAAPRCLLGLEVKRASGRLSPAQRRLAEMGAVVVVRSAAEAVARAAEWLEMYGGGGDAVARRIARAKETARQLGG